MEGTNLKLKLLFGSSVINLPGETANHIEKASGDELRVLIAAASGVCGSSDEISYTLGIPEGDVEAAISFWRGTGIIEIGDDETKTVATTRNRQVRKMVEQIGHQVVMLRRIRFGPLKLGDLPRGMWRELTEEELSLLKSL